MMVIANIVCAMTIAAGVKSRAREPRGPERERARYSTRPTTTGGNPKNALIKTTTDRRPRKEKTARAVPTGKLTAVATTVAPTLTLIESATISTKFCDSLMVMMPSGAWLMADHVSVFQLDDRFHETGLDESSMHGTEIVYGFLVLRRAERGAVSWQHGGKPLRLR